MKVITLWQPWASWILFGWKTIETRTHNKFACLKGETIGIHAGQKFDENAFYVAKDYMSPEQKAKHNETSYPKGYLIATVTITDVLLLSPEHCDRALIECVTKRYGLFLDNIIPIKPLIKVRGSQGIWEYKEEIISEPSKEKL